MRKIILLFFAAGTLMFSCKKTINPDDNHGKSGISGISNLQTDGIVASNDSAFNVVQYAGSNAATAGSTNGTSGDPTTAQFNVPEGIAFDSGGNMFVADRNNSVIRKITSGGVVSVFAGTLGVAGYANGTGTAAKFDYPIRLAIDGSNNIYVADRNNAKIRKITLAGVVTTIAGSTAGSGATQFNWPVDVAVNSAGTKIYVADSQNNRIQQITLSGGVYTTSLLAGQLTAGFAGGTGAAAKFNSPSGVAIDARGFVLVADRKNHCIREITTASVVYRYAGLNTYGGNVDGPGAFARLSEPYGITVANDSCVYVSDIGNHNIRRISNHDGYMSTVAGSGSTGNALGNFSSFNVPTSVAIDNSGNFYVASASDNNIRKLVPESRLLQYTNGWSVPTTPFTGVTWYKYDNTRFWIDSANAGYNVATLTYKSDSRQVINVLDIDLSVNHLVFKVVNDTARTTVTNIIGAGTTAIAGLSGTFATQAPTGAPNHHASFLRIGGTTIPLWDAHINQATYPDYWKYHVGMFYINSDGTVGMQRDTMTQDPFSPALRTSMMSGWPMLVFNSIPVYGDTGYNSITTEKVAARTVLAIPTVNNHILLINTEGLESKWYYTPTPTYRGFIFKDLTRFIQECFHVKSALNLDGGGSSTMCLKNAGDNGGVTGGIGVINFPAWDGATAPPSTNAYGQQRTIMGDVITVVPN